MSDISAVINSSTSDAIDQLVIDSGRMHKVINGTAAESVTVEDGSLIPSLRKALLENLYYQTPVLPWSNGTTTQIFNQLYAYKEESSGAVSWWYAPGASATNPVTMHDSPATDANWRVVLDSATITGLYATIDSPVFTGVPQAPTVDVDDESNSIATTEFVNTLISKILQEVTMGTATATHITITGNADIVSLSAEEAQITDTLTVKDLVITGSVSGIQTTVDGEDIAPKSITTTEGLEVGGDTKLHGDFQLSGNNVTLGDGTIIDLTNIDTSGNLETSLNLNQEVGNKNFIWDSSTLNSPIFGSSGKGVTIAKDATNVTQVTWPDNSQSAWVRTLSGGVWGVWSNSIASNSEVVAGISTDKSISPAGGKALLANLGLGTQIVQVKSNLNDVKSGEIFAYIAGATNSPSPEVGGRGLLLPSSEGEASMVVLENTNNRLFVRYLVSGVWSAWVEFEGKKGDKGLPGDKGEPGDSAYEVYVSTVPEGETPLTEEAWIASLQGSSFTVNATGETTERAQYDDEAKGFAFLDTITGLLYIKNSEASADWSDGIPFKGDKGTDGTVWYTGSSAPTSALGVNHDLYYNTTTGDIYKKSSGVWGVISNISGQDGENGATWYNGTAVPNDTLGADGDYYLRTTAVSTSAGNGDVYEKTGGVWSVIGNLKGDSGEASQLPIASPTVLGGVKIGSGVTVGADGTISVSGGETVDFATTEEAREATSTTVASSPARVREFMEQFGIASSYTDTATNLNLSTHGEFFNYAETTLNHPGTSGYGRGITIPSGDGYVTQFAIENDTHKVYIRYCTGSVWSAWVEFTVAFASLEQARQAVATDVASSPARVREYMEQFGLTATYSNEIADLNTSVHGEFFNWNANSVNAPVTASYGRGITIPSGDGYVTQLGIVNDGSAIHLRYSNNAVWSAWVKVGGDIPVATTTTIGGIVVGDGLTVDANGTLSVDASGGVTTPQLMQAGTTEVYIGTPTDSNSYTLTTTELQNAVWHITGYLNSSVDFIIPAGSKGRYLVDAHQLGTGSPLNVVTFKTSSTSEQAVSCSVSPWTQMVIYTDGVSVLLENSAGGGASGGGLKAVTTADQGTTSSTFANVTGMSFDLVGGQSYYVRMAILFQTTNELGGIKIQLVGTPSLRSMGLMIRAMVGEDGTGNQFAGLINNYSDPVSIFGSAEGNTKQVVVIEGVIVPSSSGTINLQFAASAENNYVAIQQGSVGILDTGV